MRVRTVLGVAVATAAAVAVTTVAYATGREAPPPAGRALTAAEGDLLHDAEELLLLGCMRRAGFHHAPVPADPLPEYRSFPYVVDDVGWARRHGYGGALDQRLERLRENDPNHRYVASLTGEQQAALGRALNGPEAADELVARLPDGSQVRHSAGGCQSQARRELYGDLPGWYRALKLVENLPGYRAGRVLADPAYRRGTVTWSACMRAGGLRFATPADARAAGLRAPAGPARRTEIEIAVAEATCAARTGLGATARELDRHYDAVTRREFAEEVSTYERLRTGALDRAADIVRAG